jgi:Zn finger protein HypA/HybF involved in hydrogenase expression
MNYQITEASVHIQCDGCNTWYTVRQRPERAYQDCPDCGSTHEVVLDCFVFSKQNEGESCPDE